MKKLFLSENEITNFNEEIEKVINCEEFLKMKQYTQHGKTSCYDHCIAVAFYSYYLMKKFNLKCDTRSLLRGALLHDYFLYDWHQPDKNHKWHGYTHPIAAYKNAVRDFGLNELEADIIKNHMFPLTLMPPRYLESLLVCFADKYCSIKEIFSKTPRNNKIKKTV